MPFATTGNAKDESLLDIVVSKDLPSDIMLYGYLEIWASFRNRGYYHQGKEWTSSSFPPEVNFQANNTRRALVSLPEILVPRKILSVPLLLLFHIWYKRVLDGARGPDPDPKLCYNHCAVYLVTGRRREGPPTPSALAIYGSEPCVR